MSEIQASFNDKAQLVLTPSDHLGAFALCTWLRQFAKDVDLDRIVIEPAQPVLSSADIDKMAADFKKQLGDDFVAFRAWKAEQDEKKKAGHV